MCVIFKFGGPVHLEYFKAQILFLIISLLNEPSSFSAAKAQFPIVTLHCRVSIFFNKKKAHPYYEQGNVGKW